MGMAVFSFEKNNFFLKISSFLKIGVHDTFPLQRSILDHGLSLLPSSFRKAVYTQFLFTYLEHGQRGGGGEVPRFTRENRTPSINRTFAQPIFNLSRAISRFVSSIFPFHEKCIVFFFIFLFSLAPDKRGSSFAF